MSIVIILEWRKLFIVCPGEHISFQISFVWPQIYWLHRAVHYRLGMELELGKDKYRP